MPYSKETEAVHPVLQITAMEESGLDENFDQPEEEFEIVDFTTVKNLKTRAVTPCCSFPKHRHVGRISG